MERSHRRARVVAPVALVGSALATTLAVASDGLVSNAAHIALVVLACLGYAAMLIAEQRWGGLGMRLVTTVTLASVVLATVIIPRFTGDLWSYAMYGRMLGIHHVSPWTHGPAAFPLDPLFHLVGRSWRHTPSVYGPAFTALSVGAAQLIGGAALATRLFYQGLAALVLLGAGWLVWRHTRSAAAVAFLTIHPLTLMYLVNGGRNDILVGVALLFAVVLVAQGRPRAAGVTAALGALVKVTGVVGIAALFVTMVARGERRAAHRMLRAALAVFAVGYLPAGVTALVAPMNTAGALYSRSSFWSTLPLAGLRVPSVHLALAMLAVLVLVVVVRHAHSSSSSAVAASLGMLSLAAAYTLPGYAGWGLPAAALEHRDRVARIVSSGGVVLVVTYEILRHPFPGAAGSWFHTFAIVGGPLALVALTVLLVRTPRTAGVKEAPMAIAPLTEPTRSTMTTPKTLVVVPTIDEADNISTVLTEVRAALPTAHVLVVDDGSADGTPELAAAAGRALGQIEVLRRDGPRGLGPAYRAGFRRGLADGYDVLVEMDADLSHDPHALPSLLGAIEGGADLAIGSRYVPGGDTPGWPVRRRLLSRAGGWYARRLLRLRVHDVTSGFRAYRSQVLRDIDLDTVTSTGYGFQIEMTDRARQAGAAIAEIPIVFHDRTAGTSKMSGPIVREALVLVTQRGMRARLTGRSASGPTCPRAGVRSYPELNGPTSV